MTNVDEFRTLHFDDVSPIPVQECNEALESINEHCPEVRCAYFKEGMAEAYGSTMLARASVVRKINAVQRALSRRDFRDSDAFGPDARLVVAYAYRYPQDQRAFFEAAKARARERYPHLDDQTISKKANQEAASPEVAGHPTGGALDVTVQLANGELLDTGNRISDFSDPARITTLSNVITPKQQRNRLLLRSLMMEAGFAPFHGEWWHFSFGDKEWAAYYRRASALYGQIDV